MWLISLVLGIVCGALGFIMGISCGSGIKIEKIVKERKKIQSDEEILMWIKEL